jgi:choline kinase
MKAVILAAGVGKRLQPFTDQHPKCLLGFGEKTLLHRHLDLLGASGVEDITVVVGHHAEQVQAEVSRVACPVLVRLVLNPRYEAGSALSLLKDADAFRDAPSLVMDADILYGKELLERLIRAPSPDCLLVDSELRDSGEEVKVVALEDGRVWELGKNVGGASRVIGESVGIFKFEGPSGSRLADRLRIATDRDPAVDYELVINALVKEIRMGYVTVGSLPWTEIYFWEDVERA